MTASVVITAEGKHELSSDLPRSQLYNKDLAPTPARLRNWGLYSFLAFWVGLCVVIPSWSLANIGLVFGFDPFTSVLVVILGNAIVTVPLLLNSHVGAKYGIPFPVFVRASFGTWGANIAAILRGIVACGWFGIESWLGGYAMYILLTILFPQLTDTATITIGPVILPGLVQTLMFLLFLVVQVWIAIIAPPWKGSRAIKTMFDWSAPFLLAFTLFLFIYLGTRVGFDRMLSFNLNPGQSLGGGFYFWFLLLNINVGFWATMALNISDVTRFAKNQTRQMIGQAGGLIGTMAFFSGMGVLVTAGGVLAYPNTRADTANQVGTSANNLWNPINLFAQLSNDLGAIIIVLALVFVVLAQLSTNVGANVIAPANDFQNLAPKRLNWTAGVLITAILGTLIQPWNLFFNAMTYAINWLSGYGGFLGAIGGIMIADYWLLRRRNLNLLELYRENGVYSYRNSWGVNPYAIIALLIGILPPFIGWLHVIGWFISIPGYQGSWLDWLQTGSWFWSFFTSLISYYVLMSLFGRHYIAEQTGETTPAVGRAPARA
jgi:NCS1 family nucleobase:cation symporter-1